MGSPLTLRRAALDARQHRSALRRLLAGLAEPTSEEQRLDQLRSALRDETQATMSLPMTLQAQPNEIATGRGTAARKRPLDAEEAVTLIPRFRLLVPQDESLTILAVAVSPQTAQGVVAVLISSGMLELWKADPFCWHLASSSKVPLVQGQKGSLTFSRSGNRLWLLTYGEGPIHTRLFECLGGALKLLTVLQGPCQALQSGPALLSPSGLAVGLNEVHVLRWTGDTLEIVSSSPAAARCSLWPLPALGEQPNQWRLLMHCHEGSFSGSLQTLQLRNGLGELLASVPVAASSVVVPPQDLNLQCPNSFLLLMASTDWTLIVPINSELLLSAAIGHSASLLDAHLDVKRLAMLSPAEEVEVLAVSEGSVAFESHGSFWLLDWQPRQLHVLPPDWRPVAVRNGLLILERGHCELLFLEPD